MPRLAELIAAEYVTPAAELDMPLMVMSPDALITLAMVTPAEAVAKVEAFVVVIKPVADVQGAVVQPKVLSIVTDPGNDTDDVPMAPVAIAEPAERAT
jgi:hypothetical protein